MNSVLNLAIRQVARNLNEDPKFVEKVYKSYWKFIKMSIPEIDLENISEEEYSKIETNFNIPYIGKLYMDYDKIKKYNRKLKYYQNVKSKRN